MKNLRVWLHLGLLLSFALPWIKVPFFITTVSISGYLLPIKTESLARELNELGVVNITYDQTSALYLLLLAPILSTTIVFGLFAKRTPILFLDSLIGLCAVLGCLYILTNVGDIATIGLYIAIVLSLLLVASPLLNKEKDSKITTSPLKRSA